MPTPGRMQRVEKRLPSPARSLCPSCGQTPQGLPVPSMSICPPPIPPELAPVPSSHPSHHSSKSVVRITRDGRGSLCPSRYVPPPPDPAFPLVCRRQFTLATGFSISAWTLSQFQTSVSSCPGLPRMNIRLQTLLSGPPGDTSGLPLAPGTHFHCPCSLPAGSPHPWKSCWCYLHNVIFIIFKTSPLSPHHLPGSDRHHLLPGIPSVGPPNFCFAVGGLLWRF